MSNRRIVYQRPDGGVSVVVPTPEFLAQFADEEAALDALEAKAVPADATDVSRITTDDLPTDRLFRNAWRRDGERPVRVDMPLARELHMDRIRQVRDEELHRLDRDWQRAQEQGRDDDRREIEQHKQALRDLPQTTDLDAAATPDELVALWPEELPEHPDYRERRAQLAQ